MKPIDVMCWGCGYTAGVNKVTAGLRCACGSTDLDLYTGTPEQEARLVSTGRRRPVVQAVEGSTPFAEFMTGRKQAGTNAPVEQNWSEYEGPMPGPNQMSNGVTPGRCPTCHGDGYDIREGNTCRLCRGTGTITPTTEVTQPPAVARHDYPSTQTTVPFMGRRKDAGRHSTDPMGSVEEHVRTTTPGYSSHGPQGPVSSAPFSWDDTATHYPKAHNRSPATGYGERRDYSTAPRGLFLMHGTTCPGCGQGPLSLEKDHKENAWATCPDCGPLADIDSRPEIDPYDFPEGFSATGGFKAVATANARKTGRLIDMATAVLRANPGLSQYEVLGLVRTSLRKYSESR